MDRLEADPSLMLGEFGKLAEFTQIQTGPLPRFFRQMVAALPALTHPGSSIVNPAAIHIARTANSSRTKVSRRRGSLLRQSLGPVHAPVAPNALNGELCVDALEDALAHFGSPEMFNTGQGA